MIVLSIGLQCLGYYMLYSTSIRAVWAENKASKWFKSHSRFSKVAGSGMLIVSFILFAMSLNLTTGILTASLVLMTIASLMTLLLPLKPS